MVRFQCPSCRKVLDAQEQQCGQKIQCPGCGQRLLIPPPTQVRSKTVLAESMPGPASPSPVGGQTQVSCPGCKFAFSIPDKGLGRWVECPKCRTGFAAVGQGTPPVASTAGDEPIRPSPGHVYARYAKFAAVPVGFVILLLAWHAYSDYRAGQEAKRSADRLAVRAAEIVVRDGELVLQEKEEIKRQKDNERERAARALKEAQERARKEEELRQQLLAEESLHRRQLEERAAKEQAERAREETAKRLELERTRLQQQERLERERIRLEREKLEAEAKKEAEDRIRREAERVRAELEAQLKEEREELLAHTKKEVPRLRNVAVRNPVEVVTVNVNDDRVFTPERGRLYWIQGDITIVNTAKSQYETQTVHFHAFMRDGRIISWRKAAGGYETNRAYRAVESGPR